MADRIVPTTMENLPIARIDELHTHLQELQNDPSMPLNVKLLDDVELQLTGVYSFNSVNSVYF